VENSFSPSALDRGVGEESSVPPEKGTDCFPEVIWTLWRRENAITWAVN